MYTSLEDYCDMTDLMLSTLCNCNLHEMFHAIEREYPKVFDWAIDFCEDMYAFLAAIALKFPEAFKWALSITTVGCYPYPS